MKRDLKGKFVHQWHTEPKQGVSLSLTKTAWQMLEAEAQQQGISKSELVERFARSLQPSSEGITALEPLVLQQAYRELEKRSEQLRVDLEQAQACLQAQASDRQQAEAERVVYLQEMTHCQQTEHILHETEERLYLALDAARITVWDFDCRKNRVLCSENALEIWGIRAGKAEAFSRLIHPDDYERVQEISARALTGEIPYKLEYRVLSPDGHLRWIASQGKVHYDADGEPARVVGMSVDITDLKQTEQALRESEDRFRAMFDQAAVGINQVSLDGQFMLVNPAFCALTGYSADELVNMTFQEITHPEDLAIDLCNSQRVLTKEINGYVLEKRYIRKDGSVIWVNLASSAVWDAEGNPKYAVGVIEDISERKRAEVERQQVEAERHRLLERERMARFEAETERRRLYEILMQLPSMIAIVTGPDFIFEFANPTYLEIIGRSTEIIGQSARDIFPETRRQIYFDILSQIYQTGVALIQNESAFEWDRDGDGQLETGFFNCVFLALRDAAGEIQGVLLHATEVTAQVLARRQVEALVQDLRTEEERQRFLIRLNDAIRSLHDPKAIMWEASCLVGRYLQVSRTTYGEIDPTQNYVVVDQDFCQDVISIVGHHQLESFGAEIIAELKQGKTLVIDDVRQDPRTAIAGVEAFQSIETQAFLCVPLVKAERFVALFVLHHKDPRAWTTDEVALIEQVAEQTWLAVERARAEQALRESEARLQLALQVGHLGMWDWVIPTNTVTWSEGHFILLGLPPKECQASYEAWLKSVHPEDLAVTEAALQRAMQERTEYWHEYRTIRPDGSIRWVEARAQFVYDAEGQPKRMTGMLVDISERKQAEQEREQLLERERTARQAAESANRIKDEFLAVLSHELRSPLNPILGWAKLLRTRKFDQAATDKALETIERNAKLQAQLVEDLLDVSRILQGKLLLNVSPVNLATTIAAALETVRLAAQAKEIQIHTEIDSMTGLVSGDANRLQQVIWNLLSNAVKFTPSGGSVAVRLERLGNMVHVQVKDTGKGINPVFLPHIFEYFRQEDGTTTRQFGGLGLGLAIARHLVELHGGTVQAESLGEGQGATFTVKLPLMNVSVEAIQVHPTAANNTELYGLKALVVDDEADMRELVAVILSQAGAEVSVAASATIALSTLDQFQPDVLICDIGMPEVDGYVLLRKVRQRPSAQGGQIPAIALTAYASQAHQQEAIAAGFQLHLAKPIDPAELIAAVTSLLKVVPSPA